ncbi:Flp family type IVb pilin [Sandaracinus amylolyticus]|uniref:Flp family type IVb pilin n=1 Tax=Sandaracinus amylolyticus TaxID=927083 RepID=UPI001F258CDA|nr:hypothetical protein [Sandaracinus amylolyticus]UJR83800.1 Hypothetical protein I5071_58710 [Sandaracinus amylolyticus]
MKTRNITSRSRSFRSLHKDVEGAGFTEYILIVGLVVIAGIAAWTAFGDQIVAVLESQTEQIGAAGGGGA